MVKRDFLLEVTIRKVVNIDIKDLDKVKEELQDSPVGMFISSPDSIKVLYRGDVLWKIFVLLSYA